MAIDKPINKPAGEPLVKQLHYERLSQMFWAQLIFLLLATLQQLAQAHVLSGMIMAGAACLLFFSLWLIRQKRYQVAAAWMLGLMTSLCFYYLWTSDGLRDEAILGYPAILVVASIIKNPGPPAVPSAPFVLQL